MEFDLRAESRDILVPVYIFPGDEDVTPEQYHACMQERYISSVATVVGAAERFGLDIDAETLERWKRISVAADLFDSFLDESEDRDQAYSLYMQGLAYFQGETSQLPDLQVDQPKLRTAISLLYSAVAVLPVRTQENLLELAAGIGQISQKKCNSSKASEYVELLTLEGVMSGQMVCESASYHVRNQPQFKKFAAWAINALEFGTLQDGLKDLKSDSETGLTGIDFNLFNGLSIAVRSRRSFSALTRPHVNRAATLAAIKRYRRFRGFKLFS